MATADRTSERRVEVVEKVISEGEVTLTLSDEEAEALMAILGVSYSKSIFSNIYGALSDAGISQDFHKRVGKYNDHSVSIPTYDIFER